MGMSSRNQAFIAILVLVSAIWAPAAHASARDVVPSCDRACLEEFVKGYLNAVVTRDPTKAKLSEDLKYTENQKRIEIGSGLWRNAKRLGEYQIYVSDIRRGQA